MICKIPTISGHIKYSSKLHQKRNISFLAAQKSQTTRYTSYQLHAQDFCIYNVHILILRRSNCMYTAYGTVILYEWPLVVVRTQV